MLAAKLGAISFLSLNIKLKKLFTFFFFLVWHLLPEVACSIWMIDKANGECENDMNHSLWPSQSLDRCVWCSATHDMTEVSLVNFATSRLNILAWWNFNLCLYWHTYTVYVLCWNIPSFDSRNVEHKTQFGRTDTLILNFKSAAEIKIQAKLEDGCDPSHEC